jgi:hypothetical protein
MAGRRVSKTIQKNKLEPNSANGLRITCREVWLSYCIFVWSPYISCKYETYWKVRSHVILKSAFFTAFLNFLFFFNTFNS